MNETRGVRRRLSARVLVVRERRHVHERRAPDPARAPALPPRARRGPIGRSSATSPRDGPSAGLRLREPEEIWDEVRSGCEGAAASPTRAWIERGLQWPCPTRRIRARRFCTGEVHVTASARPSHSNTSRTGTDHAKYPVPAEHRPILYQFNAGTMTGRTPNDRAAPIGSTCNFRPPMPPMLGVRDGDTVRLRQRAGLRPICPCGSAPPCARASLFTTFHPRRVPQPDHHVAPRPLHGRRSTRSPPYESIRCDHERQRRASACSTVAGARNTAAGETRLPADRYHRARRPGCRQDRLREAQRHADLGGTIRTQGTHAIVCIDEPKQFLRVRARCRVARQPRRSNGRSTAGRGDRAVARFRHG